MAQSKKITTNQDIFFTSLSGLLGREKPDFSITLGVTQNYFRSLLNKGPFPISEELYSRLKKIYGSKLMGAPVLGVNRRGKTNEDAEKIKTLIERGFNETQIAHYMGINTRRIQEVNNGSRFRGKFRKLLSQLFEKSVYPIEVVPLKKLVENAVEVQKEVKLEKFPTELFLKTMDDPTPFNVSVLVKKCKSIGIEDSETSKIIDNLLSK